LGPGGVRRPPGAGAAAGLPPRRRGLRPSSRRGPTVHSARARRRARRRRPRVPRVVAGGATGAPKPSQLRTEILKGARMRKRHRLGLSVVAAAGIALVVAAGASAHAIVSPAVIKTGALQQVTLSVPTEKESLTTTKVELTVPNGFAIDSFEPPPAGWKQSTQT